MKLHTVASIEHNRITAYGVGYIRFGETRIEQDVIITPGPLIADWAPASWSEMGIALLQPIKTIDIDILIFGSGTIHRFLPATVTREFNLQGIGVEAMTTQAACGTYNMLMAEGRKVAAALLIKNQW